MRQSSGADDDKDTDDSDERDHGKAGNGLMITETGTEMTAGSILTRTIPMKETLMKTISTKTIPKKRITTGMRMETKMMTMMIRTKMMTTMTDIMCWSCSVLCNVRK